MIIPYDVDVPYDHKPFANYLLSATVVIAFIFQFLSPQEAIELYVLKGWDMEGMLGHMWLHGGIFHLIGNMIFLWVFGNAVCSKTGNLFYVPVYIFLGIIAATIHLLFDGGIAVGASGAINGIVGMYLVFFPLNTISCLWAFGFYMSRTFSLSSFWMILFWLAFDIWGVVSGGGRVAYFAHLGGFSAGFGLAILILKLKIVTMDDRYEKSLIQIYQEKFKTRPMEKEAEPDSESQRGFRPGTSRKTDINEPPVIKPEDEFIRFQCECGKRIKTPRAYAGHAGTCPGCSRRVQVPMDNN